jgi:hypothetical protein
MTIILSHTATEERRWAIVITVFYKNAFFRTRCNYISWAVSILAVASSIRTILDLLKIARQIQISCFYPAEKLPLQTIPSRPPLALINSSKPQSCIVLIILSSVFYLIGSKFYLIVPPIMTGYWSITVIYRRKVSRDILLKGRPPIKIYP